MILQSSAAQSSALPAPLAPGAPSIRPPFRRTILHLGKEGVVVRCQLYLSHLSEALVEPLRHLLSSHHGREAVHVHL